MKLQMFAVRDAATGLYGAPLGFVSPGQAIRWFTDTVNQADRENQYYMHPDDFELFAIGEYDQEGAQFDQVVPSSIARGKDVAIRESIKG